MIAAIVALVVPAAVVAQRSYLTAWSTTYPVSTSDDASCHLCHGHGHLGPQRLRARRSSHAGGAAGIRRSRASNSDGDPGGSPNLAEINANSQPGWTVGNSNTLYDVDDAPSSRRVRPRRRASG